MAQHSAGRGAGMAQLLKLYSTSSVLSLSTVESRLPTVERTIRTLSTYSAVRVHSCYEVRLVLYYRAVAYVSLDGTGRTAQ